MKTSQSDRLRQIVQHAYAHAPAVKSIMDAAGVSPDDIQTLADLEKIPVTSKDRVIELQAADPPFGGFLTVPPSTLQHVFFSPGPLYEPSAGESAVMDTVREMFAIAGFAAEDQHQVVFLDVQHKRFFRSFPRRPGFRGPRGPATRSS